MDLIDLLGASVMVLLEDGWDFTAQVRITFDSSTHHQYHKFFATASQLSFHKFNVYMNFEVFSDVNEAKVIYKKAKTECSFTVAA